MAAIITKPQILFTYSSKGLILVVNAYPIWVSWQVYFMLPNCNPQGGGALTILHM